ncbi:HIRAN domain-containing protein [Peptostreptococcus canis]|uniref:HIRAN domain-containing protein n=1 Tax=Peptostreptococcus canis TaxID=1159213 RepID=A0ABR6TIE2_9FIRM|nr:HIRAN domain-containing protein [Peptostreptococcus canis]MBC2575192.1 hypothetical protein [Peptostreptococcus canis]MBP1997633.1 hypothetical protein [Peptostreptococcus canis]
MGLLSIINKTSDSADIFELREKVTSSYYFQENVNKIYEEYLEPYDEYGGLTKKDFLDNPVGYIKYKIPINATFSCSVKLVKEPKNIHDKNAIKIMANKKQVGYVPTSLLPTVHKHFNTISSVQLIPQGGPYKQVVIDEFGIQKVVTINTDFSFFICIRYKTGAIKNSIKNTANKGIQFAKDKEVADKALLSIKSLKNKLRK